MGRGQADEILFGEAPRVEDPEKFLGGLSYGAFHGWAATDPQMFLREAAAHGADELKDRVIHEVERRFGGLDIEVLVSDIEVSDQLITIGWVARVDGAMNRNGARSFNLDEALSAYWNRLGEDRELLVDVVRSIEEDDPPGIARPRQAQ